MAKISYSVATFVSLLCPGEQYLLRVEERVSEEFPSAGNNWKGLGFADTAVLEQGRAYGRAEEVCDAYSTQYIALPILKVYC